MGGGVLDGADGDARHSGDVWAYNLGLDHRLDPQMVVGASLGYSEADIRTTYNNGTYDETGWTLSPYVIYKPRAEMTLAAVLDYTDSTADITGKDGIRGGTDSNTWFTSLSGSYVMRPSADLPLDLTASLNWLFARRTTDAFTYNDGTTTLAEATSTVRQLKPGIEAAYRLQVEETEIKPFIKAHYIHDAGHAINRDRNAYNLGGGLHLSSSATGLGGTFEVENQLGRDDYRELTISGQLAYSFTLNLNDFNLAGFNPGGFNLGGAGTANNLGIVTPYVEVNHAATQSPTHRYDSGYPPQHRHHLY